MKLRRICNLIGAYLMNSATHNGWPSETKAPEPELDNDNEDLPHYRARLRNSDDVAKEIGRLYRMARRKTIPVDDASKLGNLLSILSRILQQSEIEKRLDRLEGKD